MPAHAVPRHHLQPSHATGVQSLLENCPRDTSTQHKLVGLLDEILPLLAQTTSILLLEKKHTHNHFLSFHTILQRLLQRVYQASVRGYAQLNMLNVEESKMLKIER